MISFGLDKLLVLAILIGLLLLILRFWRASNNCL
jgi:hypothetical protein